MEAASLVARPRPTVQGAPPPRGAVDPQRDTIKKTSYRVSPGGIEVTDLRQLTHGPIVPNSIVDLYLPIIGYDGLGILTVLYRLATADGRVRTRTKLDTFARAGRLGFRRFSQLLDLLHDLSIIAVRKPTGAARSAHFHTEITLLDPPTAVPEALADQVLDRILTPWLVAPAQAERSATPADGDAPTHHPTVPELSPNSSSSCHLTVRELSDSNSIGCTHQLDVPIGNEPIRIEQGRAGTAAPRRAAAHPASYVIRKPSASHHGRSAHEGERTVPDLWHQYAAHARPTDDAHLKRLCDEYQQPWVAEAIAQLGQRGPIYKLDAVRITLERWRRENSWGSPAPRRRTCPERELTQLLPADPRCAHPVIVRFVEVFNRVPSPHQADALLAGVQADHTWEQTLHDWQLNGHRPQNIAGLIDNYAKRIARNRLQPQPVVTIPAEHTQGATVSSTQINTPSQQSIDMWSRVQQSVASILSPTDFETWIEPITLLVADETEVIVGVANVFAREYLNEHLRPLLEKAFASEAGWFVRVTAEIG